MLEEKEYRPSGGGLAGWRRNILRGVATSWIGFVLGYGLEVLADLEEEVGR